MRYSSSDIVSVSSSSAGEGKPADTVPRTGRCAPRGPGRSRCTATWAQEVESTRRSTCVQTAWLERSPVIAMSSLSLGIRFLLPVKARIIYNYGWNYVQSSVCEHLFTCQAHLFSTRRRVQKSRSLTTGCEFSGMQKLLTVAMAYVKRGR